MEINKHNKNRRRPSAKKKNFLIIYGLTLLSAALLLIIFSYLGHVRAVRRGYEDNQGEQPAITAAVSVGQYDQTEDGLYISKTW